MWGWRSGLWLTPTKNMGPHTLPFYSISPSISEFEVLEKMLWIRYSKYTKSWERKAKWMEKVVLFSPFQNFCPAEMWACMELDIVTVTAVCRQYGVVVLNLESGLNAAACCLPSHVVYLPPPCGRAHAVLSMTLQSAGNLVGPKRCYSSNVVIRHLVKGSC